MTDGSLVRGLEVGEQRRVTGGRIARPDGHRTREEATGTLGHGERDLGELLGRIGDVGPCRRKDRRHAAQPRDHRAQAVVLGRKVALHEHIDGTTRQACVLHRVLDPLAERLERQELALDVRLDHLGVDRVVEPSAP